MAFLQPAARIRRFAVPTPHCKLASPVAAHGKAATCNSVEDAITFSKAA